MQSNPRTVALALAVMMLSLPIRLQAQHNTRSLAMGEAYTAVARGLSSSFYNPANLGLPDGPKAELKLFSVGVGLNNNSFVYGDYNRYNGKHLTEGDKEEILISIPDDGINLKLFAGVEALSFAYKRFAVNFSAWGDADVNLPKDPVELALYGNAVKSEVDLDDAHGESCGLADAGLSYGFSLFRNDKLEIALGAGLHYLYGMGCAEILRAEGEGLTTDTSLSAHGEIEMRTALGGQGYSSDLGLAMKLGKRWTFGLSLLRLWEQINWNGDPEKRVYRFEVKPLNAETIDDDSVATSEDTVHTINDFTTRRPILVKTGIAFKTKRLICSMDLTSASKRGVGRSGSNLGIGLEYRFIRWFPLRLGLSAGSYYGNLGSCGFGFDFGVYSFDFAVANFGSLLPKSSKGLGLSLSNSMRF